MSTALELVVEAGDITETRADVALFKYAQRLYGAAGLVAHTVVRQSDRPDKKVYRVTDAGMEALRAWVTAPTELPATRDEFILKVASLWLAEPAQAAALLREHARRHEERLALYEGFERDLQEQPGGELANPRSPWFATYLTLQRGLSFEREYAAWCRSAAEQVEGGAEAGDE